MAFQLLIDRTNNVCKFDRQGKLQDFVLNHNLKCCPKMDKQTAYFLGVCGFLPYMKLELVVLGSTSMDQHMWCLNLLELLYLLCIIIIWVQSVIVIMLRQLYQQCGLY